MTKYCEACDTLFKTDGGYLTHGCLKQAIAEGLNSPINPNHYKTGGIETIDYLKAKLSEEAFEGFLAGNVLKYVSRYNDKNGVEDLKKANWYLARLIDLRSI